MDRTTPLMIDVIRGNLVESRHACRAVIAHSSGRLLDTWGAINAEVYPRSAIKPLQALPLVESGAAEAHGLSDQEVALACASHMGEDFHRNIVRKWLTRMGLSNDDLECGAHDPRDEDAARDVIRRRETIDRVFNNCSGKHSGFLTTALHLGEPTAGYTDAAHPVQRRLADVLSALGGADLTTTARGIDGCGIPVLGMPLSALARAMARFADPRSLSDQRGLAAERIYASMTLHPTCVRGTRGFDTAVMRAGRGRFAAKTGAEGVHIGIVPERQIGIAVKVEDGASRASGVALCALLDHLDILDDQARERLAPFMDVSLTNLIGVPVGRVRPAPGWRD